jgi:hypothetical protein
MNRIPDPETLLLAAEWLDAYEGEGELETALVSVWLRETAKRETMKRAMNGPAARKQIADLAARTGRSTREIRALLRARL